MTGWHRRAAVVKWLALLLLCGCAHQQSTQDGDTGRGDPRLDPRPIGGIRLGEALSQVDATNPNLRLLTEPAVAKWGSSTEINGRSCQNFNKQGLCVEPTFDTTTTGGGVAVLAIYYMASVDTEHTEALLLRSTGALLVPYLIQVCAVYSGSSAVPKSIYNDARVCGIYGFHHTQSSQTSEAKLIPYDEHSQENVPMYQRVYTALVWDYGQPLNAPARHGEIIIIPPPPDATNSRSADSFVDYHWGRAIDETNISFAYSASTGEGVLWFYNGQLRDVAQLWHDHVDPNFNLFRLLKPGGINRHESRFDDFRRPGELISPSDSWPWFNERPEDLRNLLQPRHPMAR
jgi:hypothetical protein